MITVLGMIIAASCLDYRWWGGRDREGEKRETKTGYRPPQKPARRRGWLSGGTTSSVGRLENLLWKSVDRKSKKRDG